MGRGAQARDRTVMQDKSGTVEVPRSVLQRLLVREIPTIHGPHMYECALCKGQGQTQAEIRHYTNCWASDTQHSIW